MPLSAADRAAIAAQWQRDFACPPNVLKPDIRSTIDAVDDWIDANATKLVNAFPLVFRSNASINQMYAILLYVMLRRLGRLRVEGE